jgi:hypothetical protein
MVALNPAAWEVQIGGLWSESSLGKNEKHYLKNNESKNDWGGLAEWLKW